MAIYLIRHAQSVGNVNGRANSHASIDLTDIGHLQAQKLAQDLPKAAQVYISAFQRTLQTAQPILVRDQLQAKVLAIEEFSYLSDARCKNTTLEERRPWVDAYWKGLDIDYLDGDDAESFCNFYYRVIDFQQHLRGIQAQFVEQHLLIFSHGQFLKLFQMLNGKPRALSAELMSEFRTEMLHHPIQNAEIIQL